MITRKEADAMYRQDLASFIHLAFNNVVPGGTFMRNWHIDAIAHRLMEVKRGNIKRLIITVPPRHLKSISVSVAFTAWLLGHDPTQRIICASYAQELANKMALDTRTLMLSDAYRRVFPHTRLSKSPLQELITTRGGYRLATSVGGTLTGRGGSIFIIDDPHKADEALSQARREAAIAWFRSSVLTRLDTKSEDAIILIQQRLHEGDLAGHLLESGDWVHLNLPATAEEDEEIPISEDYVWCRWEGDLLHPEREPQEVLDELKAQMGSYDYAAQYQQRPAPRDGGVIKWDWFQQYDNPPQKLPGDLLVQSWDTAVSAGEDNDYSVCTTWLARKSTYYLLEVDRFKAEHPELLRRVQGSAQRWYPDLIIIEAVGGGKALYDQLRRTLGTVVRATIPRVDKETRMRTESFIIEAGSVYVPREAPWLPDFQHEVVNFPKGKHDDQVDSLSQFLFWTRLRYPQRPPLRFPDTGASRGPDLSISDIMNMPLQ